MKEYKQFIIAAAWTLGGIAILYGTFYSIAIYKFGGM